MEKKSFKINTSAHGFVLEDDTNRYWAGYVQPTKGYPKKAKYPYKAEVFLMESKPDETGVNQMTLTKLKRWDAHDRTIISDVTKAVCNYINQSEKKD